MRLAVRLLALLLVVPSTYIFAYWMVFSFVPIDEQDWIRNMGSLICAIAAGWCVWAMLGSVQASLISCIFSGALLLGGVGFAGGFFGPMIFSPGANQGPLLGLFITGPMGFLLGGLGGFVYWWTRERRNGATAPFSRINAFQALAVIGGLLIAIGLRGYFPVTSCEGSPPPIDKQQLRGSGQLYLVPLGDFSKNTAERLAQHYHEKYGVEIKVIPPIQFPKAAFDAQREQYESESLLNFLRGELKPLFSNGEPVVIALTDQDIYIASYNWRYAFSYRNAPLAVVSSARMGSGEKQDRRFRKMLTKNIGLLYFHLPPSEHCRSVMYKNILGPQELDLMNEDF